MKRGMEKREKMGWRGKERGRQEGRNDSEVEGRRTKRGREQKENSVIIGSVWKE